MVDRNINNIAELKTLADEGLGMVIDPLVIRCGELFLQGKSRANPNADATWDLLTKNLQAVGTFFDSIILNEKIPVFNYADTYDMELNPGEDIFSQVNQSEKILYYTSVGYGPYMEVKNSAIEKMKELFVGPARISQQFASNILTELSSAGYHWSPSLGTFGDGLSDDEKQIAAFVLGGLIFSGYAQIMESEHLLQPKRARLFLQLGFNKHVPSRELETELFAQLKQYSHFTSEDIAWFPTFFPMILDKSETPKQAIEKALELRKKPAIADYRNWLNDLLFDWKLKGKISSKKRRSVELLGKTILRTLRPESALPNPEIKVTVTEIPVIPSVGFDLKPTFDWAAGFFNDLIPGNRYRKILSRALIADKEFVLLDRAVERIWKAG